MGKKTLTLQAECVCLSKLVNYDDIRKVPKYHEQTHIIN